MKITKFPSGWDERRVREVIAYYESQTAESRRAAGAPQTTIGVYWIYER